MSETLKPIIIIDDIINTPSNTINLSLENEQKSFFIIDVKDEIINKKTKLESVDDIRVTKKYRFGMKHE